MLAFVLLEPDEGKLSRPVPRGLGAGNRVWLPSVSSCGCYDADLYATSYDYDVFDHNDGV